MKHKIFISIITIFFITTLFSCSEKKVDSKPNIITVNGSGISSAAADQVLLEFLITTSDRICSEALLRNSENTKNAIEAIRACGTDINDISEKECTIKQEQNRFVINNTLRVLIRNPEISAKVIDEAIGITKAQELTKYEPKVSDESNVIKESELNAVKNALENASVISTACGCKTGKVLSIQQFHRPESFNNEEQTKNKYTIKTNVQITLELTE